MNVKIAFLNGDIEEIVYMDLLEGFLIKGKNYIENLRKQYVNWNKFLNNSILKVNERKIIFFILKIDEILLAFDHHGMLYDTKKFLSINFEMLYGKGNLCDRNWNIIG